MKPSLARALKVCLWAILIAVLVLVLAYVLVYHNAGPQSGDSYNPTRFSRLIAFLDSVSSGLLVFLLVGIVTFVWSARKPEEDGIYPRISYLFSNKQALKVEVIGFLRESIEGLSASICKATFTLTIDKVCPKTGAIRVLLKHSSEIVNLLKDEEYNGRAPFVASSDNVEAAEGRLGDVFYIRTRCGEIEESHLRVPIELTKEASSWTTDVPIKIGPNAKAFYEYFVRLWNTDDDELWLGCQRFAEQVDVVIENHTDMSFDVHGVAPARHKRSPSDSYVVSANGTARLPVFRAVKPAEDIVFKIRARLASRS
jgi:hypothetical protein